MFYKSLLVKLGSIKTRFFSYFYKRFGSININTKISFLITFIELIKAF